ncbi:MAG: isochorismatase family protein [Defluviicoccus sp.]|nr:isochorismatase family protein [Defluviicoccus sp.]MDE0386912.1 isochorismatase family protein [Defluviicoccus sp.]
MADDLDIYEKQGFGNRIGFGERPALIVIDFINAFNDPEMFGGGSIQSAIDHTEDLLGLARHLDLPIAFTSHAYATDRSEDGIFNMKSPGLSKLVPNTRATAIVDQLEPRPGERVIGKHYPSGFFATDLANWLARRGVDTAIVTGCTTSGCVRATVVDAMGHGFRPIVPAECSGDRAQGPHEANLFDMDQKYADVMPLAEVQAALAALAPAQARPVEAAK